MFILKDCEVIGKFKSKKGNEIVQVLVPVNGDGSKRVLNLVASKNYTVGQKIPVLNVRVPGVNFVYEVEGGAK